MYSETIMATISTTKMINLKSLLNLREAIIVWWLKHNWALLPQPFFFFVACFACSHHRCLFYQNCQIFPLFPFFVTHPHCQGKFVVSSNTCWNTEMYFHEKMFCDAVWQSGIQNITSVFMWYKFFTTYSVPIWSAYRFILILIRALSWTDTTSLFTVRTIGTHLANAFDIIYNKLDYIM